MSPHPQPTAAARRLRRIAGLSFLAFVLGACGAGPNPNATVEDVDTGGDPFVTDSERSSFSPPSNGLLSSDQVDRYIKTTLLQFDLLRKQSEGLHAQAQKIEKRGEKPGVLGGLRNLADAGRMIVGAADAIGGSYVRSARALGYNPAEMEWVSQRMAEAAAYLATEQMTQIGRGAAEQVRLQALEYQRQIAGGDAAFLSEDAVREMLEQADEMERELDANLDAEGRRNAELLRRAKPNVTEQMWLLMGWHGGGLFAWAGLANPSDPEAQRQLDEYRRVFEDALQNRVTPGMERVQIQADG
jgi:hypothetical protein